MSIPQWFADDASCGPTNSMTGLIKHTTHDRSSQQDKFTAERYDEGSSKGAFRTQKNIKQQDEYAQKFFQRPGQESIPPNIYNFDQMSRGLETIVHESQRNGDWAESFLNQSESTHHHIMPGHARSEFENFEMIYKKAQNQDKWATEFSQFNQLPKSDIEIRPEEIAAFEQAFEDAKKSANWESEFEAQEQSWVNEFKQQEGIGSGDYTKTELSEIASKLIASVEGETNPKFKNSSFMNFMKKLSNKELSIEGNKVVEQKVPIPNANWASEFETQQHNINNNNWASEFNNIQTGPHSNWAQEFYNATTSDIPNNGEGSTLRAASNEFDSGWAAEFQKAHYRINKENPNATPALDEWIKDYKDYKEDSIDQTMEELQSDWEKYSPTNMGYSLNSPFYDDYKFQPINPYLTTPNLLSEISTTKGQILTDSILILEAKVQLDPNDSQAWYQLGTKQQENEQEPNAIAALRKAVTLNPQILDAWMSLAVSYTNEYRRDFVYNALESWFDHSPKYKQLLEQQRANGNLVDHKFFTDLFIQAALLNPGENLDPDVQVGLGILYNVSEEYNKAVDCFQTALSLRPNDYLLWNKLGATLANALESEKAVNAYFNALEINPLYVRARYNLAMSFINMKEYREAAEHLLAALALQTGEANAITSDELNNDSSFHSVTRGVMSSNIWATLKVCCGFLNRPDLENKCDIKDLSAFKQEFEF
ncbi:11802_t:CDS:2 [Funneliformis geosporum]|uniref:11802_t:CDS:1 n=1 Tax=Funneliformis geosporum TaxID=1117311 RepID=A0A9W4SGU6_9GLOM|nr:11802_t:CDS:2 [Funneliformis geosporum]